MSDTTELARKISAKLPAGSLEQVCANAPEGTDANGVSYKDLCQRCLIDTSSDNQKACVAGVVAGFVQSQNQEKPETALYSAGGDCDPADVTCAMTSSLH